MSRATASFQEAFDELCAQLSYTAAQISADAELAGKVLQCFQKAYTKGWDKRVWEDAWRDQTLTPVGGTRIDFSALADARRFEVWTSDPRTVESTASQLRFVTGSDGIRLLSSQSSVCVLYMPATVRFTLTAYASGTTYAAGARVLATDGRCYRSLQAANTGHEPATSAEWWDEEPLLQILADFTIAYARGTYQIVHQGQPETGAATRRDALDDLETLSINEHFRTASHLWKPTT